MSTLLAVDHAGGVPVPSWLGVGLSVLLVGVAVAVAVRERLGLARELVVAAVRAAVQLIAVGALLLLLFRHTGLPGSLGWVAGMVLVAGRVGAGRGRGLPRVQLVATCGVAAGVVATLGLLIAGGVVETAPRVVVPIGGMVVSAAMQGTSLVLLRLREEASSNRRFVEARLALGQTSRQAFAPHVRSALRTALIPAIDNTKVVGLITLPGAMTGLIIAGVPPLTAIRYQIVVMYMVLGAAALGGLVAARLASRELFDEAHRLRPVMATAPRRPALWWASRRAA
ncbi:MAG: iron export ABC transporter permease subunit FetB [Actinomycetota bacterium]|nr:iron export ABC transporter permease subunit FetB [Actinomycetota bacterium]